MRLLLLLLALFLTLAGCTSSPPPAEPEAVKSELKQLEDARQRERTNQ